MNLINSTFILLFLLSKHLNKSFIKGVKLVITLKKEGSDEFIFSIVINNPDSIK